jgi:hypothetical protein
MGAELRIVNEELVRHAEELAALRGMSVPDAVARAVRMELEHERAVRAKVEQIEALGRELRAHMTEPVSSDHSWLYDEDGLPA